MLRDASQTEAESKSSEAQTTERSATPTGETSPRQSCAVHYASDEKVDQAMEKVFRWHDRLLAELAK